MSLKRVLQAREPAHGLMPGKPDQDAPAAPQLTPPVGSRGQGAETAGHFFGLWLALATVLLLGLAVILVLPALIEMPPDAEPPVAPAAKPGVEYRDTANQAMQAWLQLRARLELEHAARWGEPGWSQSQQAADNGARMLAQHKFSESAAYYEQALQGLENLDSERDARLAAALASAQQALADNRLDTAVEQFEMVLAIEADSEDAHFGLARARTRPVVLQKLAAGERAEAEADFLTARAAYQEAALLDPEYEPPAIAFERVSEELDRRAFQDAMTRALTALDRGELRLADRALAEASVLRPSDVAVFDAQQRLAQARQQAHLHAYRNQVATLVKAENWQAAIVVYRKALGVDATAGFARSGLDKAEQRLKLNAQFDHYLTQPERLYAEQPRHNARQLLAVAGTAPADEPKLATKIATLQRLVTEAATPVTVSLRSDGETDISIYHIGQLGAFTREQLEMLPGSYTVVGTRSGYRDVRKQLTVLPGKHDTALFIRCEEMI